MIKAVTLYLSVSFCFLYFGCNNNTSTIVENNNNSNFPPKVPSNPSPVDSARINPGIAITLLWTGGDPDVGDTARYDVYIGSSNPPGTQIVHSSLMTAHDLGAPASGLYFWQVISTDKIGAVTSGPVWRFTVLP